MAQEAQETTYKLDVGEMTALQTYEAEAQAWLKGYAAGLRAGKEFFIRYLTANKQPVPKPAAATPAEPPAPEGTPHA